jgi:hypothetical protein
MKNVYSSDRRKSTPAVLLIFDHGLDALPMVVPNSGNEQLDELIMAWIRERLFMENRKAAA